MIDQDKTRLALAMACCMAGSAAMADEARGTAPLDQLVVTATRTPTRISDLVADVTVIGRERLQAASGQSAASFLARQPGIQFSSNGGVGADSNLFIRGGDARHTLLLVDGMRIGSGTTGTPTLESLPLDQIERIEIVRGPLASLYGADAAAGVIQVFTRKGRQGVHANAAVTLGSLDYRAMSTGVSGGAGPWTFSAQGAAQANAGFDATNTRVGTSHYPDRDGFRQKSVSLGGTHALTMDWKLEGYLLRSDVFNEYDAGKTTAAARDAHREKRSQTGGLGLAGKVTPDWQTGLRWADSTDRNDTYASTFSHIETTQRQWIWDHQVATPLGMGLLSFELLKQSVESTGANMAVTSRTMRAVVLGLSGEAGPHVWQTSARKDWNTQFGGEATGALAYGYDVAQAWRVGASVGSSFVAPTFNQLYYPDFGDPTLQPERGLNRELSLRWLDGADTVKLVYFDNRIRHFIQTVSVSPTQSRAVSIPSVEMRGWTLSFGTAGEQAWGRWDASGALDVLDARNTRTGQRLKQRADTGVTLDAGLTRGSLRYGAYVKANDGSFGDDTNTAAKRLRGYSVSGVSVAWAFKPAWQLACQIDNLADKRYQAAYGYNQPGRQLMVTMRYAAQ